MLACLWFLIHQTKKKMYLLFISELQMQITQLCLTFYKTHKVLTIRFRWSQHIQAI